MRTPKTALKKQEIKELGVRLKMVRKSARLSLDDVAERLNREYGANCNKGMISKYENGVHEPSAGTVFCLARILGVSPDYLLGKTDEISPPPPDQGTDTQGHVIPIYTRFNPNDGGRLEKGTVELVPQSWTVGGRDFFGIRIRGGDLAPRYYDGDLVIFERRSKIDRDRVGIVSVGGGDAFICLIIRKRDGKWIRPLNRDLKDRFYTTKELTDIPVKIIGAAVQVRRMEFDPFDE